jgi:hypothetical protein
MIRRLHDAVTRVGDRYESFMERMARVETLGALVFSLIFFGLLWAFAWYAHIIGPWVDNLMGWGPHDTDSEGKVRWRRMWSTAVCLPGILASIWLYIRNHRNRRK